MEWIIGDPEELQPVADFLIREHRQNPVFLLYGDLGAGKTQLVKCLVKALGSRDEVSSPTFSLINEYEHPSGRIYHMDMYRLETLEEALHIGIEEYLDSGDMCFIEWPELIEPLLTEGFLKVHLKVLTPNTRKVIV